MSLELAAQTIMEMEITAQVRTNIKVNKDSLSFLEEVTTQQQVVSRLVQKVKLVDNYCLEWTDVLIEAGRRGDEYRQAALDIKELCSDFFEHLKRLEAVVLLMLYKVPLAVKMENRDLFELEQAALQGYKVCHGVYIEMQSHAHQLLERSEDCRNCSDEVGRVIAEGKSLKEEMLTWIEDEMDMMKKNAKIISADLIQIKGSEELGAKLTRHIEARTNNTIKFERLVSTRLGQLLDLMVDYLPEV